MLRGGLEPWHVIIILGLLVLLFGSRKLPDAARSIGQSLRIFKSEMKAAGQDGEAHQDAAAPQPPQPQALEQAAPAAAPHAEAGARTAETAPAQVVGLDTVEFESVRH
jgi:sec-independent protein translocase protein TatA